MWDKTSFDPVAIDKELALAERTGLNKIILSFCDVVTFHNYADLKGLTAGLDSLSALGRPVFCTEWLNRYTGSRIQTNLAVMKERKAGCMFWGLVNGKTQTNLP